MLWALIVDGQVREITDTDPAGRFHPSLHWVPCDGETRPGDVWTGEAFALAPAGGGPAPRTMSALALRRRFTDGERGAITLAASRALEEGDPTLQVWLDDLAAAGEVHIDGAEIAAGLALLVKRELLAADRVPEILA